MGAAILSSPSQNDSSMTRQTRVYKPYGLLPHISQAKRRSFSARRQATGLKLVHGKQMRMFGFDVTTASRVQSGVSSLTFIRLTCSKKSTIRPTRPSRQGSCRRSKHFAEKARCWSNVLASRNAASKRPGASRIVAEVPARSACIVNPHSRSIN